MIEVTVRNYLKNRLDVPVYIGEEPENKPSEYVTLEVIDGGRINMIDAVTFNIISRSGTLQEASELNDAVKDAMYGITERLNCTMYC